VALIEIKNDAVVATIDTLAGARVASLEINGCEILVTAARSPYDWGMYPMVPYAGRVRDATFNFSGHTYNLPVVTNGHALHGTVMHHEWTVTEHSQHSVTLTTSLGEYWPFEGLCTHTISALPDRLRCELSLTADETMPMQVGWHPWFRTPREAVTSFNAMLKRDEFGITTSERVDVPSGDVDDCFLEPNAWPRVRIENTTVEIASDCPFWVRFDAPFGDVCIEPQSGPPNGINDAPYILESGATFKRWMELRVVENVS
jgi:aldose 1-epimerase